MKKIVSTIIIGIILYSFCYTQDYNTGIGLRAGYSNGLTIKHFIGERNAVEGIISSRWQGFNITGLYEYQNNGGNIHPVKINLQKLFSEILLEMKDATTKKNISIEQCIGDSIFVFADQQMVKSILRNLFTNAIKFSHEYGEITVSALEQQKYVEIAIEDNGIGISLEAQKQLFQIDSFHSTIGTNNEKGTGLGLLICKDFVELHGGNIRVESEQEKRSMVKFSLPQFI